MFAFTYQKLKYYHWLSKNSLFYFPREFFNIFLDMNKTRSYLLYVRKKNLLAMNK